MPDLMKYAPICGGDRKRLCEATGMALKTYDNWVEQAASLVDRVATYEERSPGSKYVFTEEEKLLYMFYEKVVMEIARAEIAQLTKIVESADWKSGAWYLERTNPQAFARRRDITSLEELLKFTMRYYGKDAHEALQIVWGLIEKGREELMNYNEQEADFVNTNRRPALTGTSESDESPSD